MFSLSIGFLLAGLFWEFAPVEWQNFGYVLGSLFLYFAVVIYFQIVRPFHVIIAQIRALLTGRKYKKIYSKRTDEVGIIAHFFNQVTDTFESVSSEIREGKKVTGELKLAGELQRELLPSELPKMKGLDIVIKNRPAEELGGDNFDFIVVGDEIYMYLGDVTGHGIPAAIVMTMVNTLIHAFVDTYKSAFEIVVATNKRLKTRIRSTFFMSMVMLKWNSATRKMSFVGCGHEYILIYRPGKGVCEAIISGGIALGMIPDNSKIVKELELDVQIGDVIVLYTDGITEARNMAGEMYGLPRLQKAVEQYAALYDSEGIVQHIAKEFSAFVEEHVQEDDVTLMAIKILDDAAPVKAEQKIGWSDEAPLVAPVIIPAIAVTEVKVI